MWNGYEPFPMFYKDDFMELPNRKPMRLKNYDYSQNGFYFITICTHNRQYELSKILNEKTCRGGYYPPETVDLIPIPEEKDKFNIHIKLTEYGKIVEEAINAIPQHYSNVGIDKYVIMPDHVHLILIISVGRMISAPTESENPERKSITTVIGQMKRWVSKKTGVSLWQKSFYEHIIRNEQDYISILNYMENNPVKWLENNQKS